MNIKRYHRRRTPAARLCTACGIVKPRYAFGLSRYNLDHLQHVCRDCLGLAGTIKRHRLSDLRDYHQTGDARRKVSRFLARPRPQDLHAAQERLGWRDPSPIASPYSKRCTRCGRVLPVSEFSRRAGSRDGLSSWCKGCKRRQIAGKHQPPAPALASGNMPPLPAVLSRFRAVARYNSLPKFLTVKDLEETKNN
jgi:hypothetical protein